MSSKRILFVGGGTGGHIYPLIALAEELQKAALEKEINLELIAISDSLEWKNDFERRGIKFKKILAPKFRRYQGNINFFDFFKIPVAFFQSFCYLFWFMPDLVFVKGGYTSIFPSLAAIIFFIPIYVHESDSIPGLANRFISIFSKKVFVSFETAFQYFKNKVVFSGNPIRKELLDGEKESAAKFFNFNLEKKTILFLGGSQGAVVINNLVIESLIQLIEKYQIIHQVGIKNFDYVKKEIERIKGENALFAKNIDLNYRFSPFLNQEELKNAYALADVVISRAGANTIFEISALAKPAIVIPISRSANNHQEKNAQEFAKFGAIILEEENLKPHILLNQIDYLLRQENYSSISERIKEFGKIDAGKIITELILEY